MAMPGLSSGGCADGPRGSTAGSTRGSLAGSELAMAVLVLVLLMGSLLAMGAQLERDVRSELSPAAFALGSRYGRSEQRAIQPRNDRFLIGNRYGKRARGVTLCREGGQGGPVRGQPRCRSRGARNYRHTPLIPYRLWQGRWVR